MAEFKSRISPIEKYAMVGVALLFDLLSIIPLLNIFVEVLAVLVFSIWFITNGIPPRISYKVGATAAASAIVGFIPILSILPEMTAFIVITLYMYNQEEKKEFAESGSGSEEITRKVMIEGPQENTKSLPVQVENASIRAGGLTPSGPEEERMNANIPDTKRATKLYGREFLNGKRLIGAQQGIIFGGGSMASRGLLQNAKPINFQDPRVAKSGQAVKTPSKDTKPESGTGNNDNELGLAA